MHFCGAGIHSDGVASRLSSFVSFFLTLAFFISLLCVGLSQHWYARRHEIHTYHIIGSVTEMGVYWEFPPVHGTPIGMGIAKLVHWNGNRKCLIDGNEG